MARSTAWDWQNCLPGVQLSLAIPARLEFLPVLGTVVREYCAILPHLFPSLEDEDPQQRQKFGTSPLKLAGQQNKTVQTSYSHFVYSVELILQEATSNIIRHGYAITDPGETLRLRLGAMRSFEAENPTNQLVFLMEISDTAAPFDPTKAIWHEPDPVEPRESGYGIYLIRKLTDDFTYHYDHEHGQNILWMLKYVGSFS